MEFFLERIARSLRSGFGDLSRHRLVFPGRRAALYLIKYLSDGLDKPIWSPSTFTINELIRSWSPLQIAGTEILLYELYRSYSSLRKNPESFDEFYFWGDMLLNDFDDIDKYMADASAIFSNVKDLKDIDNRFGSLDEDREKIIKQFWLNFDISKSTPEKEGFISLWSLLPGIYESFRSSLREKNLAYEGMIFRDVAGMIESVVSSADTWETIHFIGFNALNSCEKEIMLYLKKAGKARFYWDYDESYIGDGNYNSAGYFMRENLKLFGNDMPDDWTYRTFLSSGTGKTRRQVIETSSDIGQVKLIPDLISGISSLMPGNAHHTAIILADENLLMPLLSSLPENDTDVNITMGYPLKQTLVYSFTRQLMDLQSEAVITGGVTCFPRKRVAGILKHPFLKNLIQDEEQTKVNGILSGNGAWIPEEKFSGLEIAGILFKKLNDPAELSEWFREILSLIASSAGSGGNDPDNPVQKNMINEFIYRIILSLNRLGSVINAPGLILSGDTYIRILDRLLKNQSVPFSGEPLSGIQIMGILETRALDFTNLIILSVNEGVMPSVSSPSSFIPYSLREAFGIPSINHQESVYAYHFYRLLHRAENVVFTYNSGSEGLRSGEMSRFLVQMNYNKVIRPDFLKVGYELKAVSSFPAIIYRNDSHTRMLNSRFLENGGRLLSPSAINTWLSCRMKFLFRYIIGLKEPEKISEDIDPAMFGNILHEIMRRLYSKYIGNTIVPDLLDKMLGDDILLQNTTDEAILSKFKNGSDSVVKGNELITRDIIISFIKRILHADKSVSPLTILNLEEYLEFPLDVPVAGSVISLRTGGYADRIDMVNQMVRIVDYKTGTVSESIKSVDELFAEDKKKDSDGWMQVLLYCEAFLRNKRNSGTVVMPSIYRLRNMSKGYHPEKLILKQGREEIPVSDYNMVREQFMSGLKDVIARIFNPEEPFTMTNDARHKCSYCPFKKLCAR